ncbi:hypothetical protein D3C72_1499240 [compost metagenome]
MVQHAHRKHRVESGQLRQLLNTERQQVGALIAAQQLTHRFELAQEQLHRIYAHRQMRTRANHAPQVITAAAADVKNGTTGQR